MKKASNTKPIGILRRIGIPEIPINPRLLHHQN